MNEHAASSILSLSNESYQHYLLLRYASQAADRGIRNLDADAEGHISPEEWILLHNYAQRELESHGGKLIAYEIIDERLVRRDTVNLELWPADWMWVIQKKYVA